MSRLSSRCFEAAEGVIRGTGLRRSKFGRAMVALLNRIGQFGLKIYFLLKRHPVIAQGQQMDCRLREKGSFRSTLEILLDRYEPQTTRLFHRLLRPGMTVVDIGAHSGYFSLIAANHVGPGGKVYAFEPHASNYEAFERNVALNRYENIVAVRKAVTDNTGKMRLLVNPKGSDRHSLYVRDGGSGTEDVEVETTTLDDFLREQDWPHIDLIKMDIEGAEPAALAGMSQALKTCGIRFLVTEFSPSLLGAGGFDPEGFLQELSRMGFSLYVVEEEKEPKPLSPGAFSALTQNLRARGGTNLFCESVHSLPECSGQVEKIADYARRGLG